MRFSRNARVAAVGVSVAALGVMGTLAFGPGLASGAPSPIQVNVVGPDHHDAGRLGTVTAAVSNSSAVGVDHVSLTVTAPPLVTFLGNGHASTGMTCTLTNPHKVDCTIPVVHPGEHHELTVAIPDRLSPDALPSNGPLTVTATATWDGSSVTDTDTNPILVHSVVHALVEAPTDFPTPVPPATLGYIPKISATWIVHFTNFGPSTSRGGTLTATLDPGLTVTSVGKAGCTGSGNTVTCSVGDLQPFDLNPAGDFAVPVRAVAGAAGQDAPKGANGYADVKPGVVKAVTATAKWTPPNFVGATSDTRSATVTIQPWTQFSISGTISSPVRVGGQIEVNLNVGNVIGQTAVAHVKIQGPAFLLPDVATLPAGCTVTGGTNLQCATAPIPPARDPALRFYLNVPNTPAAVGTYHVSAIVSADVPQPGGEPSVVLGSDVTILPALPTSTPASTPTPLKVAVAPVQGVTPSSGALPVTGSSSAGLGVAAVVLVLAGTGLLLVRRGRRDAA